MLDGSGAPVRGGGHDVHHATLGGAVEGIVAIGLVSAPVEVDAGMPSAAAVRSLHELVSRGGVGEHRLQEAAVGRLDDAGVRRGCGSKCFHRGVGCALEELGGVGLADVQALLTRERPGVCRHAAANPSAPTENARVLGRTVAVFEESFDGLHGKLA